MLAGGRWLCFLYSELAQKADDNRCSASSLSIFAHFLSSTMAYCSSRWLVHCTECKKLTRNFLLVESAYLNLKNSNFSLGFISTLCGLFAMSSIVCIS